MITKNPALAVAALLTESGMKVDGGKVAQAAAICEAPLHRSCYRCAHLVREQESWEMPNIWWWECAARPGLANLKSFPFMNTKCAAFQQHRQQKEVPNAPKND